MLTYDSVKLRLEREAIFKLYMEFNYMMLQAFDFINCTIKKNVYFSSEGQINGVICKWSRFNKKNFKKRCLWINDL